MNIAMKCSESREFEQFVSCFASPARAVEFWNFWPSESVLCCEKRGQPQFCHTVIASGALCCGLPNRQHPRTPSPAVVLFPTVMSYCGTALRLTSAQLVSRCAGRPSSSNARALVSVSHCKLLNLHGPESRPGSHSFPPPPFSSARHEAS